MFKLRRNPPDQTRQEAEVGRKPERTGPEAGPDWTGMGWKPDQTGSRTRQEAGVLQQYCCNSTVARVLLQ